MPPEEPEYPLPAATRAWVRAQLAAGEELVRVTRLTGGWSAEMRLLRLRGPAGEREWVLRSFVKPFPVRHAPGMLRREAGVLRLLRDTDIPVAALLAVDPEGRRCAAPSLLMTRLPGRPCLDESGAADRSRALAAQLVRVHRVSAEGGDRPPAYRPWTSPETVRVPGDSTRPALWQRAVDILRAPPPLYEPRFLHRDFHPGNVLFAPGGDGRTGARITGVVDWVETSWGPAELDLAHCSTNLALLYGAPAGLGFTRHYLDAGGRLTGDPRARLYWHLLDALAFAPYAEQVAAPWRELGRADLTEERMARRLEEWVAALFERYG
ncbi:phosphotransferase family protein [Streptomyces physcomitrii]|uniref:Phosphotransferase n=1 Tax=Streptomyces physcomitrii TaxID=2724184 RepID=A0ABX1H058_9ACTN|nr:phosphotransferase [Streptomyces physcomitrii]NKI41388.1 phosphotransferase [Streptomyces physcomitrii]